MNPRFFQLEVLRLGKFFFLSIALVGLLSACGDEITNITEPSGAGSPATETSPDTVVPVALPNLGVPVALPNPGAPVGPPTSEDLDGDGLSNVQEKALGTSPILVDTDGDGFSDFDEIVTFGFDPSGNRFRFNPLIADSPKIAINLLSAPGILINYTETNGSASTISTSRSQASSSSVTRSDSGSHTNSFEHSYKEGLEVETTVKGSINPLSGGPKAELRTQLSFETTQTKKNEWTSSWSNEQTTENSTAFEKSKVFESSHEISAGNGEVSIVVSVSNNGNLSYTLQNLILSATYFDLRRENPIQPVGNLDFDSPSTKNQPFPEVTLAPGQRTGPLNFANAKINLQTVKQLLSDSQGLTVTPALFDMIDEEGNSFNFDLTVVQAQGAMISIDFGVSSGRPPINEWVAVNGDPEAKINVRTVLEKVFGMTIQTFGEKQLLTGIDGINNEALTATDPSGDKGHWVMSYAANIGNDRFETSVFITKVQEQKIITQALKAKRDPPSNMNPPEVDPMELSLHGGDILFLTYIQDSDLDGLGDREEFFYRTDPFNDDTDDDGLKDGQEIQGWRVVYQRDGTKTTNDVQSNPLVKDTDHDGLNDFEEANLASTDDRLRRNPLTPDTDGDGIPDHQPILKEGDPKRGDDLDAAGKRLANIFDPTDIKNLVATYKPLTVGDPTVDLQYDLVDVMGTGNFKEPGNNIDTYKVLLLRFNNEKKYRNLPDPIPGPIDNNDYNVGTRIPCNPSLLRLDAGRNDASSCDWVVADVFDPVFVPIPLSSEAVPLASRSVTDKTLVDDSTNGSLGKGAGPFKYIAYLQINGHYIRSSQSTFASGETEIVQIRMMGGWLINNIPLRGDKVFDANFKLFIDGRQLNMDVFGTQTVTRQIAFSNVSRTSIPAVASGFGWNVFADVDPNLKNTNLKDKFIGGGWNFIDPKFTAPGATVAGVPVFEFRVPAINICHKIRVQVAELNTLPLAPIWQFVSFPSISVFGGGLDLVAAVDTAKLCREGDGIWTIQSLFPRPDANKAIENGIIGSAPGPNVTSNTGFSGRISIQTNSIFPIQYQTRPLLWNYFTPTGTTGLDPAAQSGDIRIRYDVMVKPSP